MRWPRRHKTDEAERELANIEIEVVRVHGQWPRIRRAAGTMDTHRDVNHLAELIRDAMGVDRS